MTAAPHIRDRQALARQLEQLREALERQTDQVRAIEAEVAAHDRLRAELEQAKRGAADIAARWSRFRFELEHRLSTEGPFQVDGVTLQEMFARAGAGGER